MKIKYRRIYKKKKKKKLNYQTHGVQIFNSSHHTHGHFAPIGWSFGAGIQSGSETFTNFFYSSFQLISLEEDDKNRFENLIPLRNKTRYQNYFGERKGRKKPKPQSFFGDEIFKRHYNPFNPCFFFLTY